MITVELEKTLKQAHIRKTPGLMQILSILLGLQSPIDIAEIERRLKSSIHIATIYRILEKLEKANIVTRLVFGDKVAVYELNRGMVSHFSCTVCHKKSSFQVPPRKLASLHRFLERRYAINLQHLELTGMCRSCMSTSL